MFTDKKGRAHGNLAQRPWYTIRSPEGAKEETAVLLAWEATRWGREEEGGGASLNKRVEDASSAPRGGSGDQFLR